MLKTALQKDTILKERIVRKLVRELLFCHLEIAVEDEVGLLLLDYSVNPKNIFNHIFSVDSPKLKTYDKTLDVTGYVDLELTNIGTDIIVDYSPNVDFLMKRIFAKYE